VIFTLARLLPYAWFLTELEPSRDSQSIVGAFSADPYKTPGQILR
jgi:hypothetical protein